MDSLRKPEEMRSAKKTFDLISERPASTTPRLTTEINHPKTNQVSNPSELWVKAFSWYGLKYVAKNFNAVRMSDQGCFPLLRKDTPIIIYLNHASWWDPMIGLVAWHRLFQNRKVYTPIDSEALKKYRFFSKLGFFGVKQGTVSGARQFLRQAGAVLKLERNAALIVTPQGRFVDVRERPLKFLPGLSSLAARTSGAFIIPMAVEYTFWDEKRPEALIRFGEVLQTDALKEVNHTPAKIQSVLEQRLLETMDQLKNESLQRDPCLFTNLLNGKSGVSPVYDAWRSFRAWLKGERFDVAHSKADPGRRN